MIPNEQNFTLPKKYHDALVNWQRVNFPEIELLTKYWEKYFNQADPFKLRVRICLPRNDKVIRGKYRGWNKFKVASEMKGSMLYQALRIIKAQCSTELGSIQQHRDTLDASYSDYSKFCVMRIMA